MKGYPKSRFEIINQSQVQSIETTTVSNPTAIYLQPYTSNKGTEDWELLYGFDGFTKAKGGMSFHKHGQAQLTVAQALRTGAYVIGKRLVSEDATLANTTVLARLVKVDNVTYVYFYTKSARNCGTFEDACRVGYGTFDASAENITDIPLFTVTPMGRGESLVFFRINPINISSKKRTGSSYMKYSFEVIENNETLESITITMNPDIIIDGASQAMNPKIREYSDQVRVKLYEDGVFALVKALANTAVDEDGNAITTDQLINMDFINGFDNSGTIAIGGVVTTAQNDESKNSEWIANKPADIEFVYDLANPVGIPLANGSYGTMGNTPMSNPAEMEKMLLAALGKNTESELFDSIIYDLDAYKIDAIFDCNWPVSVKNAITDLVDFRGDMVFFEDLGTTANTLPLIAEAKSKVRNSNYTAVYHNYFKILDPFTRKEITVTMPYLLISNMTNHVSKGVNKPFAGIANNIYFTDIIENTINYLPVEIPGMNQKQELVDMNVNYISIYDGLPTMETMYVNTDEYTQLSYLHNIMAVQEIIKIIRTRCPRTRYTFLDGDDLETYIADVQSIVKEYSTHFKSISCQYMADASYRDNNIFYAVLKVQFKNFIQEEYFKIIAIS